MTSKKIVIVGGVAGGANVAARLRRLDENCEITIHERGGYVSFANCGLPYHIGGEIQDREKLLLHSPESLKKRFALEVRIFSEVIAIDRAQKVIQIKDLQTGRVGKQSYDILVLSPGASPLRPNIPGLDLPGIYSLRDIEDMDRILEGLRSDLSEGVAVVGAGFIGLEMVEQLHRKLASKNIHIRLLEAAPHVLPPLDYEMAAQVEAELDQQGIECHVNDPVQAFEKVERGLLVHTKAGKSYPASFVLFNIGVRPEISLAQKAGLEIGARGGISVDSELRTSDPDIFALGDCIETVHLVTGEKGIIPLASPANRQGRIVADVIAGREAKYKRSLGTAIVRVFDVTVGVTGINERTAQRLGIESQSVHLHPASHASYYPGAKSIHIKLLYSPVTQKILGAQAIGAEGVDKRIDVFATAIYAGLTIDQLTDLELSYAPPFGSAKDPVNIAGMVAMNTQEKLVEIVTIQELSTQLPDSILLDVRDTDERALGYIPSSIHIPLWELRTRLCELPNDKQIIVYCQSGQRSYIACRILSQRGFRCKNLSGAYKTWAMSQEISTES